MRYIKFAKWLSVWLSCCCLAGLALPRQTAKHKTALLGYNLTTNPKLHFKEKDPPEAVVVSKPAVAVVSYNHASNATKASRSATRANKGSLAARLACIAKRENGGDYGRSSNPTHFGKYQFSFTTWVAYGGNPNTWGTASATEQESVFANAIAQGGINNWTNYDNC